MYFWCWIGTTCRLQWRLVLGILKRDTKMSFAFKKTPLLCLLSQEFLGKEITIQHQANMHWDLILIICETQLHIKSNFIKMWTSFFFTWFFKLSGFKKVGEILKKEQLKFYARYCTNFMKLVFCCIAPHIINRAAMGRARLVIYPWFIYFFF